MMSENDESKSDNGETNTKTQVKPENLTETTTNLTEAVNLELAAVDSFIKPITLADTEKYGVPAEIEPRAATPPLPSPPPPATPPSSMHSTIYHVPSVVESLPSVVNNIATTPVHQPPPLPPPSSINIVAAAKDATTTTKKQRDSFNSISGGSTKPHSKVSPVVTNMHNKLNFIPHGQRDTLNTSFLGTLPGVLKVAELIIGFFAFILTICADRKATSSAWAEHITFETTIVVAVFLIGYIVFPHLTLENERTRNGLVVVELIFYSFNAMAYFIAVWLMIHLSASWTAEGRGAAVMGAIMCVALAVLYGIETFIKYKAWKGEEVGNANSKIPRMGHATMVPGQKYGKEHELSRDMESV